MLTLPALRSVPSPNFSSRNGRKIDLVVIHDCEGNYQGSISWFANVKSQVSAHYVLRDDGAEVTQMVDPANKAWHVVAFNSRALGIEMAGFKDKGFGAPEWQAAADITAYLLHKYDILCGWSQKGEGPGFCSHYDLGVAGGGHVDPTTDPAVWSHFIDLVIDAYAQPVPSVWAPGGVYAAPQPPAGYKPTTDQRHDLVPGTIEWVQSRLNVLGFARPALSVDGMMGPMTRAAVTTFQRIRKLVPDGDPGPLTLAALGYKPAPVLSTAPKPATPIAAPLAAVLVPPSPIPGVLSAMFNFSTITQTILSLLPGIPDDVKQVEAEVAEFISAKDGPGKGEAALHFAQTTVNVLRQALGKPTITFPID